ncbi:hypothetical protein [Spirosoma endophyticum]|nr:hypothetical protein [Spirosoma endophyticum]
MLSCTLLALFLWLTLNTVAAQTSLSQLPDNQPHFEVLILIGGKPANLYKGIPLTTQILQLEGYLTRQSQLEYAQLKPEVTIHRAIITLVRKDTRLGSIVWTGSESLGNLPQQAKKGDQYEIRLDDVRVQTKDDKSEQLTASQQLTVRLF